MKVCFFNYFFPKMVKPVNGKLTLYDWVWFSHTCQVGEEN